MKSQGKDTFQTINEASLSTSDSSDDEQDHSFPLHQNEDTLASFREKWQKELKISNIKQTSHVSSQSMIPNEACDEHNFEKKAKLLFLKGVELEKKGKLYEAIQFYRKAVQIVPDIEFRVHNVKQINIRERKHSEECNEVSIDPTADTSDDSGEEEILEGELLPKIQKKLNKCSNMFISKTDQRTTHISVLPFEIVLYILRWVVSSDLDMRSLETCALVSRGFYVCARDPEIWKLACLRVWGHNCGSLSPYTSWREMFIERPRLTFNGCYVSKTTYMRHGENSFQDQFYRPWHLISYYRYLRFFPEGTVLMLTSSDDPAQTVGQLKYRNARAPVMQGYFRVKDDKVTLVIQRQDNKVPTMVKRYKRRDGMLDSAEQTFHMELQIISHGIRKHTQLVWTHYSIFTRTRRGDESTSTFDLVTNRFPPFWFSRVKSYTSESEAVLQ